MRHGMSPGHRLHLLEGGQALFAAMASAIDAARDSVWLETYILQRGAQTEALVQALAAAAQRGVQVHVTVDGVGTGILPAALAALWTQAGVQYEVFAPLGRLGLLVPSQWRRLHRKLCVVDARIAFCGGINVLDDWVEPDGERLDAPRLDFAVQVEGPLVGEVAASMQSLWWRMSASQRLRHADWAGALAQVREGQRALPVRQGDLATPGVWASWVERDNVSHRSRIERAYLRAIGRAQREVLLAHAYFVPGRRLRRALKQAVARGVRVRVLLQSRYENFMQFHAAQPVHHDLMRSGVELYRYVPSSLHAKVAVVDGEWATVGSSNLDPLSLLLAREANVLIQDAAFAGPLQARLEAVMRVDSLRIDAAILAARTWRERLRDHLAYGLMRVALWLTGRRY